MPEASVEMGKARGSRGKQTGVAAATVGRYIDSAVRSDRLRDIAIIAAPAPSLAPPCPSCPAGASIGDAAVLLALALAAA